MSQTNPADPGELEARLELVRSLFDAGKNQAQVVRFIREECSEWGIADRQARNYCYAVWKQYNERADGVDRAAYFVRTLDRLDFMYGEAIKIHDIKTALAATAELIKLLRLDIPSADFDWRKAAKDAGLSPSDVFERVVQAVQASKVTADDNG